MQGTWENGNFVLASTKNDEIQQLRNRVSELEADARRYRWLRSPTAMAHVCFYSVKNRHALENNLVDEYLDSAIDQEMENNNEHS